MDGREGQDGRQRSGLAREEAQIHSGDVICLNVRRAKTKIDQGIALASKGKIEEAIHFFKESSEILPTAEAFTYWGWMLSFRGRLEEAIELCHRAIAVDPDFGNPYNDIGTYLMKKGELDSAIPWLEKAKQATRYEAKHFPYMNLGRIYLSRCQFDKALAEFEVALQWVPENEELRVVTERIRRRTSDLI